MKQNVKKYGKGGAILMSKGGRRCPDVLRNEDGDFLVIGEEITDISQYSLPEDVSCDVNEKIVLVPKKVMLSAIGEIVNEEFNKE